MDEKLNQWYELIDAISDAVNKTDESKKLIAVIKISIQSIDRMRPLHKYIGFESEKIFPPFGFCNQCFIQTICHCIFCV